jgi:hypothetical protein
MSSAIGLVVALLAAEPASPPRIGKEATGALVGRLRERKPFLESEEAHTEPATLRRYFQDEDYRLLRGNPILGYWDQGGFRWTGNRMAWSGIEVKAGCSRVASAAWNAAFSYVVRRRKLDVDRAASIRIGGACVWAVVDGSRAEPVPGVLLEMRVESPTGILRYRFGMGKPTVEDAVGAAIDFIVGFAQAVR